VEVRGEPAEARASFIIVAFEFTRWESSTLALDI
jgi:hypothetical protein